MNLCTWCGAGMGWMWIFPVLFFLVMLAVVVLFCRRGFHAPWCRMMGDHSHETPREILDRRYASGEIGKQQYEEARQAIQSR